MSPEDDAGRAQGTYRLGHRFLRLADRAVSRQLEMAASNNTRPDSAQLFRAFANRTGKPAEDK